MKLGEVLTERQEKPLIDDLITGKIGVVGKISFTDGKIQLRATAETKTNMILIKSGDLVLSGINAEKGAVAIYNENPPIAATIHYGSYFPNKEKVDIKFLWYFFRSHVFKDLLIQNHS